MRIVLNYTSLASAAEIPKSTIIRYISALEQAFLVHRIPAWSFDLSRRLTKLLSCTLLIQALRLI